MGLVAVLKNAQIHKNVCECFICLASHAKTKTNPTMNNQCQAITHRGNRCKNQSQCGYCHCHHSMCIIPLYTEVEGWPSSCVIRKRAVRCYTSNQLVIQLNLLTGNVRPGAYYARLTFMSIVELIKLNKDICEEPHIQAIVETGVGKLGAVPSLADYVEDFKRKCSQRYKDAARKRVYTFYFGRCEDLCYDVIEKILTYV